MGIDHNNPTYNWGGHHLVSSELIDAVKPEKAIKPEMDQTKRLKSNKHLQEGQVVGLFFG